MEAEEGEGELLRLREIGANNSDEELYEGAVQDAATRAHPINEQDISLKDILEGLSEWSWAAKRSERLIAAAKFLRQSALIIELLSQSSEASVLMEARRRKQAPRLSETLA